MHLSRVPGPIPDPFFEAVRRRHADVDIVLLPPEEPPVLPAGPHVDDAAVHDALARSAALAAFLWRAVRGTPEEAPPATLARGPIQGTVQPRVRVVRHDPGGRTMLLRLKDELVDRGWRVDRIPGPIERVLATGEDASVSATFAPEPGTFILELTTPPLLIGAERARTFSVVP